MKDILIKIEELRVKHNIPDSVVMDVIFRINDHIESGGSKEDRYIESQFEYLDRFIKYNIQVVK